MLQLDINYKFPATTQFRGTVNNHGSPANVIKRMVCPLVAAGLADLDFRSGFVRGSRPVDVSIGHRILQHPFRDRTKPVNRIFAISLSKA